MEACTGIPHNYFDIVYSIYAIGWSTDLRAIFQHAFACLKQGGIFVFSWDHPFHALYGGEPGNPEFHRPLS